MSTQEPTVFVADDDEALEFVAQVSAVRGTGGGGVPQRSSILDRARSVVPGCLVLDVQLPGLSGLDLQTELAGSRMPLPIVFLTEQGDIPISVKMKVGAVGFLTKLLRQEDLVDAIREALERDRAARGARAELAELARR